MTPSTALFRTSAAEASEDNVPLIDSGPRFDPVQALAMARMWDGHARRVRPEFRAPYIAQRDEYLAMIEEVKL